MQSMQCCHRTILSKHAKSLSSNALSGLIKCVRQKKQQCTAVHVVGQQASQVKTEEAVGIRSGNEIREAFLKFFEERGHNRVPSSSLVPDDPTVLLTIAGMLQFKRIFLGQQATPKIPRATSSQKCVRTNDIENVGVTKRHHTFFEMLGNFSFGDYFKSEAIKWSWELSTQVFGIPEDRIWVSVFETDDEAYNIWKDQVGVSEDRIIRMGEEDNFWASGATGPCGPCSELYYDFHPERGTQGADLDDDSRFIEFYNLVFMELQRDAEGVLSPLSKKNIDTGMGLERMAQILQGVPNNYETDLIYPIIQSAAQIAGIHYFAADETTKSALKVIGDHIRAVSYLISDGVIPSNIGRGYVLRRLIRRVIIKGKVIGIKDLFTAKVAQAAVEMSDGCDPQVKKNSNRIYAELSREEEKFRASIDAGQKVFAKMIVKAKDSKLLSGQDVFTLYDTFGFPLEITEELAEAEGLSLDLDGFQKAMEEQRQISQAANADIDLTLVTTEKQEFNKLAQEFGGSEFLGYDFFECNSTVLAILQKGQRVESVVNDTSEIITIQVALDRTVFYAESGGQVSDLGVIKQDAAITNGASQQSEIKVVDCSKIPVPAGTSNGTGGGELFVHKCELPPGGQINIGNVVHIGVDDLLRRRVMCNHTATHLLQSALKNILGEDTSQQGSLVDFERLRFDFNLPRGMSRKELFKVETMINEWIQQSHNLETSVMPLEDARAAGAVAMFGEKYDDVVRVVNVPNVSMELCGGTHVSNTADIGGFKILTETGIASGIRRIEAVAGPCVIDYLNSVDKVVRELSENFKARPDQLLERVKGLQDDLKSSQKENTDLKCQLAVAKSQALLSNVQQIGDFSVIMSKLDGIDGNSLQTAAQSLQEQLGDRSVIILASTPQNKVGISVAFGDEVIKRGFQAGKFVGAIAKKCGGGGGGRPQVASAGGKDPSKLDEALQNALEELNQKLI